MRGSAGRLRGWLFGLVLLTHQGQGLAETQGCGAPVHSLDQIAVLTMPVDARRVIDQGVAQGEREDFVS